MNYKNECISIIENWKQKVDIIPDTVGEIENDINNLDDSVFINKTFLSSIWLQYVKKLPYDLILSLFCFTKYHNMKLIWEQCENPDIILIEHINYPIQLTYDQIYDIFNEKFDYDVLIDTLDIPVIFDLNTCKWYIFGDSVYGNSNIYNIMTAKELCRRQYNINKEKENQKNKEKEEKKAEKERIKAEKKAEKERIKAEKKAEKERIKAEKNKKKNIEQSLFA